MRITLSLPCTTIKFGVYHFTDGVVYVVEELDMVFREPHITLLPFGTFITFLPHIFFVFNYTLKILEASAKGHLFPDLQSVADSFYKVTGTWHKRLIIIGQKPFIIVHFCISPTYHYRA